MRRVIMLAVVIAAAAPTDAFALRWTLGLATEFTPVVLDAERPDDLGTPVRLGVRPVVELEPSPYISIGAYAPFVVWRTGEGGGAASSGAESVFGVSLSGRYPVPIASRDEELMLYGTGRFGFGTISGRAGPLFGGALGVAYTWLDTGRGLFAEASGAFLSLSDAPLSGGVRDVRRTTFSVTIGLLFRFGGERWRLE